MMEELVVSAVLVGAVLGAAAGGTLTGRFGRRWMIILAGIVFSLSAIGTALAPTVGWLIGARVASGVGIGIASFISPMYIAELVPAKVRGSLVAVNMLAITTGIVVAYLVDYASSASHGWRYMFGLAALPSIGLVIGMGWLPDSPRWLISRSKIDLARQVLQRARTTSDVSAEIKDIQHSMEQQGEGGMVGLLRPSLQMPMIVGLSLATFQQLRPVSLHGAGPSPKAKHATGLGSPTYPLPPESYAAWTSSYQWRRIYGHELLYSGPLFTHQISHLWFDLRGLRDEYMRGKDSDYFENSRRVLTDPRIPLAGCRHGSSG